MFAPITVYLATEKNADNIEVFFDCFLKHKIDQAVVSNEHEPQANVTQKSVVAD